MKLRRVTISPAENGFTVEKSYEPGKDERYQEPEMTVHESVDSAISCVKDCLSGPKTKVGQKMKNLGSKAVENAVASRRY